MYIVSHASETKGIPMNVHIYYTIIQGAVCGEKWRKAMGIHILQKASGISQGKQLKQDIWDNDGNLLPFRGE